MAVTTFSGGQSAGVWPGGGRILWPLLALLALGVPVPLHAEPLPLSKKEQAKVDQAIDKAIAFLKRMQTKKGNWEQLVGRQNFPIGATALPALALLEAGVPADDPAIRRAAEWLRAGWAKLNMTYDLSLALLFFDRLGDPQDKAAIRSLALRLIAGQCDTGGWGYSCPTLSLRNEQALGDLLRQWEQTTGDKAPPEVPQPLKVLTVFQDSKTLPWMDSPTAAIARAKRNLRSFTAQRTDNSNTQFAILALWAARRHALPVGPALRLVVRRFESSQSPEGLWGYNYADPRKELEAYDERRVRSMTTVGLLGLALRHGLRPEKENSDATPDVQVLRGFAAVSLTFGK